MKFCVYGAGAIGGFIAGHLAQVPGVEVSVVARGPHLQAIRERGLRVIAPGRDFTVRVRATDDPAELGVQDHVFITLKSHQVTPALDAMAPLLGPDTAVLPPTTGIPYWYFHGQPGPFAGRRLERLDPRGRQWDPGSGSGTGPLRTARERHANSRFRTACTLFRCATDQVT